MSLPWLTDYNQPFFVNFYAFLNSMFEIGFLEAFTLVLLSAVKILFTPIGMIAAGYSFWTTVFVSSIGGILGVVVFFFLGKALVNLFNSAKKKKVFTKQNRFVVKTKQRFGLIGMAATMGIISVPLSTVLVAKYYAKNKWALPTLIVVVVSWSLVVSLLSLLVYSTVV